MAATNLLPPPPRVRHASSVAEWLMLLHLDHLTAKFSDYTLEKLSTLLDIELASVRPSLSYLTRGAPDLSSVCVDILVSDIIVMTSYIIILVGQL